MMISVVIPVFNSSNSLNELYSRLVDVLTRCSNDLEIIMVDDSSQDSSFSVMQKLRDADNRVKIIRLEKNAGQHNATLCGLKYSQGNYVVTIDDDLQNPPEEIPILLDKIRAGYDVVFGIPREKQHNLYRNWGSRVIDKCITIIFPLSRTIRRSSFRIMTQELVKQMLTQPRTPIYMAALILTHSLKPANVEVQHEMRKYGKSNYGIIKTLAMTRNLLINYSYLPVKLMGIIWSLFFFTAIVWLLINKSHSSNDVAIISAIIILAIGAILTLFSMWLGMEYWLRQRRDNRLPQLPYIIRDIKL